MSGFQHILFPVDFSARCRAVRPLVKSVAHKLGAKVTLMHVLQLPQGVYSGSDSAYPIVLDVEAMQRDCEQQLTTFFEAADPPTPAWVETARGIGEPASMIAQYVEKNGVDLVMMPTHGYGKFRSLLLGSVTAKVLYDVACSVWTATHTENPALPGHAKCERILCAVDLAPDSVAIIHRSVELAGLFGAKLWLVHAVAGEPHPKGFDENFRRSLIEWSRDELAKLQREAGTNLEVCIESGAVSKLVSAAALNHDADLVVIGRGKLHKTLGRLRSNAYAIVRDAPCPVLSL